MSFFNKKGKVLSKEALEKSAEERKINQKKENLTKFMNGVVSLAEEHELCLSEVDLAFSLLSDKYGKQARIDFEFKKKVELKPEEEIAQE